MCGFVFFDIMEVPLSEYTYLINSLLLVAFDYLNLTRPTYPNPAEDTPFQSY